MYYTRFNTNFCEIILAGDEKGLARLHLNTEKGRRRFHIPSGWRINDSFFKHIETQVTEYFRGKRKSFDVVLNPQGTAFQRIVWDKLSEIPYGQLKSYGDIARAAGNTKAARAVGAACGKNPVPLIIPCHRVIGAGGKLAGYAYGISVKEQLIKLEQGADALNIG